MNKITQRQRVLNWLQKCGPLTTRQAVLDMNIMSLPKRIEELRREGYAISMEYQTTPTGARYGVYRLEADDV